MAGVPAPGKENPGESIRAAAGIVAPPPPADAPRPEGSIPPDSAEKPAQPEQSETWRAERLRRLANGLDWPTVIWLVVIHLGGLLHKIS